MRGRNAVLGQFGRAERLPGRCGRSRRRRRPRGARLVDRRDPLGGLGGRRTATSTPDGPVRSDTAPPRPGDRQTAAGVVASSLPIAASTDGSTR
ncbi:hypothetical protein SUDANB6_05649 [Streptomyces sp. enrichment culture]